MSPGENIVEEWFKEKGWKPFGWQKNVWDAFNAGQRGILNAPTGSGKTYALFIPTVIRWIEEFSTPQPAAAKRMRFSFLQLFAGLMNIPKSTDLSKKMDSNCCGSPL